MHSNQYKKLQLVRWLSENMLAFIFQYAGLALTTLTAHPSPLWFASGSAVAFIFMRGTSIIPGLWLGSFFAYYFIHAAMSVCMISATLFSAQAYILLRFCYEYVTPSLVFIRVRHLIIFIAFCSVLTALASLLLLVTCYEYLTAPEPFLQQWCAWWLANLNGLLIISLALYTWDYYFPEMQTLKQIKKAPLIVLYAALLFFICKLLFFTVSVISVAGISAVALSIAYRYRWCGIVSACFLCGMLLTLAGSFTTDILIFIQLTLVLTAISGLLVAAKIQGKIYAKNLAINML